MPACTSCVELNLEDRSQYRGGDNTTTDMPRAIMLPPLVLRVVKTWESYQVELQGHYSVERLHEFALYEKRTSILRVAAVQTLTLIPPIVAIILPDILPLNPPVGGLKGQSASYWIRTFYSVLVISVTSIEQFHHASSWLPLKLSWLLAATVAMTAVTVSIILALHVIVGFPTPFLYQFASGLWQVCLFTSMWMMWKKTFRDIPESWQDLKRFIWLWLAQVVMIVVYPVLGYVFRVISSNQKTIFTMILPFWKMVLKLWTNYGAFRIEDQTPVFVVFTVDVFHALFLSSAMQSSSHSGYGTLLVIVGVDIFQSFTAIADVRAVLGRIRAHAQMIDILEAKAATSGDSSDKDQLVATTAKSWSRSSSLDRAIAILDAHHHIRDHPEICVPRYKRDIHSHDSNPQKPAVTSAKVTASVKPPSAAKVYVASSIPDDRPPSRRLSTFATDTLNDLDYARLKFVRETMQLLHMVEFYMLIEFTEVFITLIYSMYLVVMAKLPNRVYYAQLETISDDQWGSTVAYVFQYSGYEFVSYVALAVVFRVMTRISGAKVIGFSLEKHWRLVQSLLVLWVFFVIQMSLKHLGSDYTFKFEWLKKPEGN